jgi:hypothetical protein
MSRSQTSSSACFYPTIKEELAERIGSISHWSNIEGAGNLKLGDLAKTLASSEIIELQASRTTKHQTLVSARHVERSAQLE